MTTTHHKAGPQQLWAGAAALFLLSAAANMASPLYPLYQQAYRMPDVTMTLLYATFAATAIPALLLFGSAADALGRKPVLLAGLCCAAGGTALFAVDGVGVSGLFVARVLLGVGLGLGTGAGIAFMVEASAPIGPHSVRPVRRSPSSPAPVADRCWPASLRHEPPPWRFPSW